VRSTSRRLSSSTSPARKVALVSPWTPPTKRGDVDVDDVAVVDHGRVRDAVADDLVEAGAAGLREAACSPASTGRRRGREVLVDRRRSISSVVTPGATTASARELQRLGGDPARRGA
jgi:hypothetical protein